MAFHTSTALAALSLVVSSASYGMTTAGHYVGGGTWKMDDGSAGTWTETTDVVALDGATEFTTELNVLVNGQVVSTETSTTQFVDKGNGFFDVKVGEAIIGSGYCYDTACHYDYKTDTESGEETFNLENGRLLKIGSTYGEDQGRPWKVAYRGELQDTAVQGR